MRKWARGAAVLAMLVLAGLPVASANPAVPYCETGLIFGTSGSTSDNVDPALCEALTGRVFPEAHPHQEYTTDPDYLQQWGRGFAKDFVSYFEFQRGLEYIEEQNPDYIEVHEVAQSYGLVNAAGGRDRFPIYMVEITNEKSSIAKEDKLNLLFMLSIHGNEKGGREGGFRVLEDLVLDKGFAHETIQNGAGLPGLVKDDGSPVEDYRDILDFATVYLLFPNADGWAHDEPEYVGVQENFCLTLFCRANGNGADLNRQLPTIGWQLVNPGQQRLAMNEPEAIGYGNWIVDQKEVNNLTWNYAIDIHGMLNHKNFGAIMLPAGSFSPQEMQRNLRLAENLKERWNADEHFNEWRTLFQAAQEVWAQNPGLCDEVDCSPFDVPLLGNPVRDGPAVAGSDQFAEYYTVIDAIGYTDSGFSGDFFAQTTGLNAPGYDIELAYNHITVDSQYEAGSLFNDYHVHMVRHIVKSFLDAASLDVQISYETNGLKTAYIEPQYVATNADDVDENGEPMLTPGGWADENTGDDAWDYGPDQVFTARPARYWEDMQGFLCDGCAGDTSTPGVLQALQAGDVTAETLAIYDNLVIPGTAINQFIAGNPEENSIADGEVDADALQTILDWVDAGGNLILTDSALNFFDLAGMTDGAVDRVNRYMGGISMDLEHELLAKVRGGVKQTYEPTPLGYAVGSNAAPNWFISQSGADALGASVAGVECGRPNPNDQCPGNPPSLGFVDHGAGRIQFIGSLLPDPTEEFYHPYGLDHYATTYSGNQIMRNMLGWDEVLAAPPITITEAGEVVQSENERATDAEAAGLDASSDAKESPGLGLIALLGVIAFFARRR